MRTVFKYPLPIDPLLGTTRWVLDLPASATVVAVGHRNRVPTLWVDLRTEREVRRRVFVLVGTGQPVPEDGRHVGSFQTDPDGEDLVFHVYEIDAT